MEIRTFSIPGKPQGKGRPRFSSRSKKTYTPEATRRYEELVKICYLDKYRGSEAFEGPVSMELCVIMPIPKSASKKAMEAMEGQYCIKKPDTSNVQKAVEDALNGLAYRDDNQLCRVFAEKIYETKRVPPQVLVHLIQMEGKNDQSNQA
jgi:Holliday junction resolvase RusA-like endonuclease